MLRFDVVTHFKENRERETIVPQNFCRKFFIPTIVNFAQVFFAWFFISLDQSGCHHSWCRCHITFFPGGFFDQNSSQAFCGSRPDSSWNAKVDDGDGDDYDNDDNDDNDGNNDNNMDDNYTNNYYYDKNAPIMMTPTTMAIMVWMITIYNNFYYCKDNYNKNNSYYMTTSMTKRTTKMLTTTIILTSGITGQTMIATTTMTTTTLTAITTTMMTTTMTTTMMTMKWIQLLAEFPFKS